MSDLTTAFWGMTINNYDETDLALVQQGYPDHIRQIVYTLERGEEGTPHIQAFIKLNRQQRLSYVKKLFPRGSFKALLAEEYKLNAQRYAQKLDKTAESPAVINNNPFPDPVVELLTVIEEAFSSPEVNVHYHDRPHLWRDGQPTHETLLQWLSQVEFNRVRRTPRLVKFYVSPTYRAVKKEFLIPLKAHFFDTHTHTHTQEKLSHAEDITDAGEDEEVSEVSGGEEVEQGEDDEGDFDSSGSESEASDESDDSGCSESDAESED